MKEQYPINFYNADTTYSLKNKTKIKCWILDEVKSHEKEIEELNIILCSDPYLLNVNIEFLNHRYYTDIITFDNGYNNILNGEIYLSVDRIKENAKSFSTNLFDEFLRVIIHGVWHLVGFSDSSPEEKKTMRAKEDQSLKNYYSCFSNVPRGTLT